MEQEDEGQKIGRNNSPYRETSSAPDLSHASQNSGEAAPDTDKQFFGAPRPAEIERILKDSQNSGDWEIKFDELLKPPKYIPEMEGGECFVCGTPTPNSRGAEILKDFIRTEIDRAERRVRENLRYKLERMRDVYDDDVNVRNDKYRIEGYNKALLDVLNLL